MSWLPISPLSDEWKIPKGSGHKFLLKYLRQQQVHRFGKYYDGLSNKVMIRNMKLLCDKYSDDDIKRAIAWACSDEKVTQPFSTKLIEQRIQWLSDIRECPTAQFYQNKS